MREKRAGTSRRLTITERAYGLIKRGILQGEIEEGRFLSEAVFRKKHGIGRTPFREACNRLHHEQILEVVPRHGYFVPAVSFAVARALVEARIVIEGAVAEVAAVEASPEQVNELERLLKPNPKQKGASNLREAVITANTNFHLCLARLTGNEELFRVVAGLLQRSERIAYVLTRQMPNSWVDHEREHRPIVEALRKRDPRTAREAVANELLSGSYLRLERVPSMRKSSEELPQGHHSFLPQAASL